MAHETLQGKGHRGVEPRRPSWIVPAGGIVVEEEVWADPTTRLRIPALTPQELRKGVPSITQNIVFEVD